MKSNHKLALMLIMYAAKEKLKCIEDALNYVEQNLNKK